MTLIDVKQKISGLPDTITIDSIEHLLSTLLKSEEFKMHLGKSQLMDDFDMDFQELPEVQISTKLKENYKKIKNMPQDAFSDLSEKYAYHK